MQSIGVVVASLTFDGLRSNVTMANILGCKLSFEGLMPSFKVDSQTISLYYDPCHMMKLVRNTFGDKQVMIDYKNRKVDWRYIEELHNVQETDGLNFANRLRGKHVSYQKQKMKVYLATQLLSKSVADAIEHCRELGMVQFEGSEGTVEFLRNMNDVFDVLNSTRGRCI